MKGAVVITGPTASGKSSLALALAERLDTEIISADSAQVYVGMDIGTAKPDPVMRQAVTHHLIDVRDPADPYSAADFRADVEQLVPEVLARGRLPVIAGGTMLYLKALKEGLATLPAADADIRRDINRQADQEGWDSLHAELRKVDPPAAARIRPTDTQRLQRAVEVYRKTGVPLSVMQRRGSAPCPFPLVEIAIVPPDRSALHQAIEDRFHRMLAGGLVDEVRLLHARKDLNPELPAIRAVGYRQIWSFLAGEITHEEMVEKAIAATRQLAKRQYTWLRRWQDLRVLEEEDTDRALKILRDTTILN